MSHDDDVPCDVRIISKMAQDKWHSFELLRAVLTISVAAAARKRRRRHWSCRMRDWMLRRRQYNMVWRFDTLTRKRTKIVVNIRELSTLYPIQRRLTNAEQPNLARSGAFLQVESVEFDFVGIVCVYATLHHIAVLPKLVLPSSEDACTKRRPCHWWWRGTL